MTMIDKKISVLAMIIVLTFSLAGCGKREVNYDIETQGQSDDGKSASGDDATAGNLKTKLELDTDTWEQSFSSDDSTYLNTISADIIVPETASMSVMELEKKTFTNEEKQKILEALCDEGSVYVCSDAGLPDWYLEYKLAETEKEVTYYGYMKNQEGLEARYQNDIETCYQNALEQQEKLQTMQENGAGIGIKSSDYSEEQFIGDINGLHYELTFSETGFTCEVIDAAELVTETLDESMELSYYSVSSETEANQCSMTEGEMEIQVRDLLNSIGLDAYMIFDANPLQWNNYFDYILNDSAQDNSAEEKTWYDGYSFVYTRSVNGINVDYADYLSAGIAYWEQYHEDYVDWMPAYGLEYMNVQMNAQGLVSLQLIYPYEVKQILTEDTQLLPISKIEEMIQDYLSTNPNPYNYNSSGNSAVINMIYTKLELVYMRVCYDDKYTLLPVWRLSGWDNDDISRLLCVNAIDGSVIDILDNIYNVLN